MVQAVKIGVDGVAVVQLGSAHEDAADAEPLQRFLRDAQVAGGLVQLEEAGLDDDGRGPSHGVAYMDRPGDNPSSLRPAKMAHFTCGRALIGCDMDELDDPAAPSDDVLLFVMQGFTRALAAAFEDEYPGDPQAAKRAASEHIVRCMADPRLVEALTHGAPPEALDGIMTALERHRVAFAEAQVPGVGTPNAFNL